MLISYLCINNPTQKLDIHIHYTISQTALQQLKTYSA